MNNIDLNSNRPNPPPHTDMIRTKSPSCTRCKYGNDLCADCYKWPTLESDKLQCHIPQGADCETLEPRDYPNTHKNGSCCRGTGATGWPCPWAVSKTPTVARCTGSGSYSPFSGSKNGYCTTSPSYDDSTEDNIDPYKEYF